MAKLRVDGIRVPNPLEVTLAEVNSELITLSRANDPNLLRYIRAEGTLYRNIPIPTPSAAKSHKSGKPFYPLGLKGGNSESGDPMRQWIDEIEKKVNFWKKEQIVNLLDAANFLWNDITQPLRLRVFGRKSSDSSIIERLHSNYQQFPSRALAWHPYRHLFAIAHRSDIIYLYDFSRETYIPQALVHKPFMKEITALEWKPLSGTILAASSQAGICLWRISIQERPPLEDGADGTVLAAWLNFLRCEGVENYTSLSWHPDGQLLAAGAAGGKVAVWDVVVERVVELPRLHGEVLNVKWSPSGEFLCAATSDNALCVFETQSWTMKKVKRKLPSHVKTVCWTPDGSNLLYSLDGGDKVYILHFLKSQLLEYKEFSPISVAECDASMTTGKSVKVGGSIHQIALDPTGERLAISFEQSELIAVFMLRPASALTDDANFALHVGFIRGPTWLPTEQPSPQSSAPQTTASTSISTSPDKDIVVPEPKPYYITFAKQFARGCLLSVCWENGVVGFVPFYFVSDAQIRERKGDIRGVF
ncbi:uncharacterized protein VTP21DRAFT_7296 [Calcarisporiella thermophila]|uniref:uncharacterized protein n=1 Tax=Calcarisporiella thermophila TaxID=911321 RepID=UPI0037440DFD